MLDIIIKEKMRNKLNTVKVANSLAITVAIAYLVCIVAIKIAPELAVKIGNYLFHGIDISSLVVTTSIGNSLISLVTGAIISWLIGALFAAVYNKLDN